MKLKELPSELRNLAELRYKELQIKNGTAHNIESIQITGSILEKTVFGLFTWVNTPEGGDFWCMIDNNELDRAKKMSCYPKISGRQSFFDDVKIDKQIAEIESKSSEDDFYKKYWI